MKKIKPLGKNVLVELVAKEEKTAGGIVIPDTADKERPQEGVVVAVGDSSEIPETIKKGTRVLFKKYGGDEIKVDNKEMIILNFKDDILGVIEE